jgi:hypothetical protein
MALYEAIRQGQMKIADGLKNGQMRSDGTRQGTQKVRPIDYKGPEPGQNALLGSEERPLRAAKPSKALMVGLGIAAQVLILGLGIWLGVLFVGGSDDQPPVSQESTPAAGSENDGHLFAGSPSDSDDDNEEVATAAKTEETKPKSGFLWMKPKDEKEQEKAAEAKKETVEKQPTVVSSGSNVIVIQSISPGRENELKPLQSFFQKKGIATRIIADQSDYSLLVTKAGFKKNPGIKGTDGYVLYNRIMQLGLSFVDETGITDFGTRPFQDIYGKKLK